MWSKRRWVVALLVLAAIILGASLVKSRLGQPAGLTMAEEGVELRPVSLSLPEVEVRPAPPGSPNVLLITIDTLRADALGVYGNTQAFTPTLDSLARGGAFFTAAITPLPQTNPTHTAIFTGTYPPTNRVRIHQADILDDSFTTLAEALKEKGYTTAGLYSWVSFEPQYSGLQQGFDNYQGYLVPTHGANPERWEDVFDGRADVTTDAVMDWLAQNRDGPFFVWTHYNDPHFPYAPPPPFDAMYDPDCEGCVDGSMNTIKRIAQGEWLSDKDIAHLRALYKGEVSFVDSQIARIVAGLDEMGIRENTVIVVTADHGEAFAENGLWFHPGILYNSALRIPLIVSYPPLVPAGTVVPVPASSVDIMPTILDIAAITVPSEVEGKSLMPLVLGTEDGTDRVVYGQVHDDGMVAVVAKGWKYIADFEKGWRKLYDFFGDPTEQADLMDSRGDVAAQMEQLLQKYVTDHDLK